MRITVLAGGIGAARFLTGLRTLGHDITVIGNNGDDVTMYGLRICPDLDTVMYTLGGGISAERGWGREDETFRVRDDIGAYVAASGTDDLPSWFGLGDLDLATHLVRAHWLAEGLPLSTVTARLCARWETGVRLMPSTDDPVETHVTLADGERVHFQEWWVRLHASVPANAIELFGAADAQPAPGVVDAIADADVVLLPPSNPVVSVGTILAIKGIREAVVATAAPVVGVSPIIGGAPVRGMADACLAAIGVETSAYAVARHYGDLLDGWLVDESDKADADRLAGDGLAARAVPLWMSDIDATARIADAALTLAADVRK
ncbi:MAG: 2-phospho-L-lactate transferase [Frankiaceae bacterium]|jgi:LPPG:FO 2-phospho-L-lactate transferase|nr:2-phospho-L-lactate transferase [Frankiaceae bacterium]